VVLETEMGIGDAEWTIDMWVRCDKAALASSGEEWTYFARTDSSSVQGSNRFRGSILQIAADSTNAIIARFGIKNRTQGYDQLTLAVPIAEHPYDPDGDWDKWFHFALTFDKASEKASVYINGVESKSSVLGGD
jgi:hypothetical protein